MKLFSQITTKVLRGFANEGKIFARKNFMFNYIWKTSVAVEHLERCAHSEFNALIRKGYIVKVSRGLYEIISIPNDYNI